MNQTYSGGWKPGDMVTINAKGGIIAGRRGVVADANGNLIRALSPGEVPVRIAFTERLLEETAIYLLQPEWLEEAQVDDITHYI